MGFLNGILKVGFVEKYGLKEWCFVIYKIKKIIQINFQKDVVLKGFKNI